MKYTVFILSIVMLAGCKPKIHYNQSPNGLKYRFIKSNEVGKKGSLGDIYLLNLKAIRADDSTFIDTEKLGHKLKFQRGRSAYPGDFQEALSYLKVGDSAHFKLRADSFYQQTYSIPVPEYLRAQEVITFQVGVEDILNKFEHKMKMFEYELSQMEDYVKKQKWTFLTDSTGIKYEITQSSEGEKIEVGDEVRFKYLFKMLDDRMIARTNPDDYPTIIVGDDKQIPGLNLLLTKMKKGEKARALIPYSMAYGEEGNAFIPAYTTVVIELETINENP